MERISISPLTDSLVYNLSDAQRKARVLIVDVEILSRDNDVGIADYEKIIPRLWSGYWYTLTNESVIETGAIQFARQRLYFNEFSTIQPVLNAVYKVRRDAWDFLDDDINPFSESFTAEAFVERLTMNQLGVFKDCGSFPTQPIGAIGLYIPTGVVLSLTVQHLPYCDAFIADPNDPSGETVLTAPVEPDLLDESPNDVIDLGSIGRTFDDSARAAGYILASECEVQVVNTWLITCDYASNGGGGTRQLLVESTSIPQISGVTNERRSGTFDRYAVVNGLSCGGSLTPFQTVNLGGTIRATTKLEVSTSTASQDWILYDSLDGEAQLTWLTGTLSIIQCP